MNRTTRMVLTAAAAAGIGVGAFGIASAGVGYVGDSDDGDSDAPLAGADRERAEAAALEHVGGGTVTESEIGDDGAAYEVEIRLDDGTQVEINLDADFVVTGTEPDDD